MNKQDLRILFMGTPDFAKASLEALIKNDFNVVGVFAKEDKPKGRGMKLMAPPIKECAIANNIPVFQPSKIKDNPEVMDVLKKLNPNLLVVVAYGKILPNYILDYPKYGAINVHGSILPKYRGAAPIQWSVINGDTEAGITTMYMDEGLDTGDMITISKVALDEDDTYEILHDKLMVVGANTLVQDLEKLIKNDGMLDRTKQPEGATYAPMISKETAKIDFNNKAEDVCNLIRGTNPFPGAWCNLNDNIFKIYKAKKIDFECAKQVEIGQIVCLDAKKDLFIVKCIDGYVNILELKMAGTRQMTDAEFIRGGKVKENDVFK